MYTIGEFAAFGRVSARMLRHYDRIGLLVPARVDEYSGYRYYDGSQRSALALIVELRELGCSLEDAASVLRADDTTAALAALLERRRRELEDTLAADTRRLDRIGLRLRLLRGDTPMSTPEIVFKDIPAARVYEAVATAPGFGPENISPVIGPLFDNLYDALSRSGAAFEETGIAWYEQGENPDTVYVHAGFPAGSDARDGDGFRVLELPALAGAATTVHHGDMSSIGDSWGALMEGVEREGYRMSGPSREVYLRSQPLPQTEWVTELQQPVAKG
ncbi:MerR family transcriptional regulator [Micromonospora sp. DT81.3]|uniref:MerR family transcriptional regulator n=1 Tax=Micromonospora sp. DT81.3 TaxID=3416523 RepID=UPI003CF5ECD5